MQKEQEEPYRFGSQLHLGGLIGAHNTKGTKRASRFKEGRSESGNMLTPLPQNGGERPDEGGAGEAMEIP